MQKSSRKKRHPAETKQRLVEATVRLMLHRGFPATTVDEICTEAGLTKGSFFHYFESKEAIGEAALACWASFGASIYAEAMKDPQASPLEQIHRLFDIMIGLTRQPEGPLACLVGMLSQEMAVTHPILRKACATHLTAWTEMVSRLLTQAKAVQRPRIDFDPEEIAWFLNSVWQGSMLISKACQAPEMIANNLQRTRLYIDGLFTGSAVHFESFSKNPNSSPLPQPKNRNSKLPKKTERKQP